MSKFCRKCGNPLKPQAKFCGGCGAQTAVEDTTAVQPQQSAENVVVPGTGTLGGQVNLSNVGELNKPIARNSHLIWNLEQGQIAQKLPPNWMDYYDAAKGLIIHPGTMGLFYINGKFHTRIESGEYIFDDDASVWDSFSTKSGGVGPKVSEAEGAVPAAKGGMKSAKGIASTVMDGVANGCRWVAKLFGWGSKVEGDAIQTINESNPHVTQAVQQEVIQATRAKNAIQVVLIRGAGFPVVTQLQNVDTASIQATVGVELFVFIKDADAFYNKFMVDRTLVTAEQIRDELSPILQRELVACVANLKAEDIKNNIDLISGLQSRLQNQVQNILPYLGVERVVEVSSDNLDLQRLRKLQDELYISELELDQVVKRNEFKNRLRLEENKQKIRSSTQEHALEAQMMDLNKDKLLDEADFAKHVLFVQNDLRISAAKTEDEYLEAVSEIEKTGILREEELTLLKDQTAFNRETNQEWYRSSLELQHIATRIESAKAELKYEREVGDDQLALEAKRSREALLHNWDEQRIGLEMETEKVRAQAGLVSAEVESREIWDGYEQKKKKEAAKDKLDLEAKEDEQELTKLVALQELKQKGKKAEQDLEEEAKQKEHERREAEARGSRSHDIDLAKIEQEKEAARLEKGGSAENILAAQGLGAESLGEKYKADAERHKAEAAARSGVEQAIEGQREKADQERREKDERDRQDRKESDERMERMMGKMMESNAAIATGQISQKQDQLEREQQRSSETTKAVTGAVGAGAAAVGEGMKGGSRSPAKDSSLKCPQCATDLPVDSAFCTECGHKF